jgi:hypothetical protein
MVLLVVIQVKIGSYRYTSLDKITLDGTVLLTEDRFIEVRRFSRSWYGKILIVLEMLI